MASSADNHLPNLYSATAAPPPTPSAQHKNHFVTSSSAAADALSRLLHRLPPTLSLPTRRSSAPPTSSPLISISDPNADDLALSAASQLGFFQLADHGITSQLAKSAEVESLSLFELSKDLKEPYFPRNWPLGYDDDDDGNGESFWLDSDCTVGTTESEVGLSSLKALTRGLEKVGLEVIEMFARAVGFENPINEDPTRVCSMMWVHEHLKGGKPANSGGGFYPYLVCLEYQIRYQKYSLLADSGWVTVSPQVDSVMVTVGDIAQVWSNGKLKKVRGRPMASIVDGDDDSKRSISMSLLVTLPMESIMISPLPPRKPISSGGAAANEVTESIELVEEMKYDEEERSFVSFSFEDYAWRVYHEPLLFKDALDKYRI